MAQLVKNPPAMWETWVPSLGWEDPLEKFLKATHSSILAWRIPWTAKSQTRLSEFHSLKHSLKDVHWGFLGGPSDKEPACTAGDLGSIPGLGRSPGEENGYPLEDSGLKNPLDCLFSGVAKSRTQLNNVRFHCHLNVF